MPLDDGVEYHSDELSCHMVIDTPVAKNDHVKIILRWEQDPRSAVVGLAKVVENEDYLLNLFAAAQALVSNDDSAWETTDAPEDESR